MEQAIAESPRRAWRLPSIQHAELDKMDLRILSILQQNCRINLSSMARHLRCSKSGLHYRIKRMEDAGIIRGYKAHFNLFTSQFVYHLLFLQCPTDRPLVPFMHALHAREDVVVLMSMFGEKNIMLGCVHTNEKEFDAFAAWIKEQCHGTTPDSLRATSFSNMELDYSGNYEPISALGMHKDSSFIQSFSAKKANGITLTQKDFQLMRLLEQDARITLTQLAETIGCTKLSIRKRLDELIRSGIISKFSASVTPYAFPGMIFAALLVRARSEKEIPVLKRRFMEMRDGNGIIQVQRKWNLAVFLHFPTTQALTHFRETLHERFPEGERFQLEIVHEQSKLEYITPQMIQSIRA